MNNSYSIRKIQSDIFKWCEWAWSFQLLLSNKIPIIEALEMLGDEFSTLLESKLMQGLDIVRAIEEIDHSTPAELLQLIKEGELSGNLTESLRHFYETYAP